MVEHYSSTLLFSMGYSGSTVLIKASTIPLMLALLYVTSHMGHYATCVCMYAATTYYL